MTLDNLNTQKNELHTNSEDISEIKLISLLPSAQNSHLIIWTLLVLNIFYLILIIALTLDQILNYWELNVVGLISSLGMYKILFSFSWLAILLILMLKSTSSRDFQHKIGNQWDFCTVEQKAAIFLLPWSNFETNFNDS